MAPENIAFNISPVQFKQKDFVEKLFSNLNKYEVSTKNVELELTENVLMDDTNYTINILHQLRENGVSIAIDDFGTGYSSLSYLRKFPLNILKIDRSFINEMVPINGSYLFVQLIILLGKSLGMKIVAEGVETGEQYDLLKKLECEMVQGYFFSKPLPQDAITELLQQQFQS